MRTVRSIMVICAALMISSAMITGCSSKESKGKDKESSSSKVSSGAEKNDSKAEDKQEKSENKVIQEAVTFSIAPGFYDKEQTLELSCDEGLEIRYTTDGSVPTAESEVYSSPISLKDRTEEKNVLASQKNTSASGDFIPRSKVTKANVIRAAAFKDGEAVTEVCSHTYFIGIDREGLYGDVPVISLMTDMDNLYDYETGIYVLGKTYDDFLAEDPKNGNLDGWKRQANYKNKGREWERPVAVEFIDSEGVVGFDQDMGIRIMGAASRNATQKSFRLTAREDYGKKNVKYPLIPDNIRSDGSGKVEKYKSFTLRNGGNDCDYAKMRDPLLQSLAEEMDFELQQAAPCVVFLDGEYWGMYSLTEDYSDNYIQNNYPIEKENVVMLKCGELEAGEEADYELYTQLYELATGSDMTVDENYKAVGELLDLDSFIDYCAFNMYIGNSDCIFDDNNWRMWRVRTPDESCEEADGKWRMMVYDTDFSTGIYGETADKNPIDAALNNKKANGDNEDPPADIFTALMKNPEFSQKMMLTLMDMRNFTFEKDRVSARIDEFDAVYSKLVPDTFKRFGPQYSIGGYGRNVKGLREYLSRRYDTFIYSINDSFHPGKNADVTFSGDESKGKVYVNGHRAFLDKEVSAKYFLDYPITVGAQPKEGQKFVKWECSGCTASDPTSPETQVTIGENGSIKAIFE